MSHQDSTLYVSCRLIPAAGTNACAAPCLQHISPALLCGCRVALLSSQRRPCHRSPLRSFAPSLRLAHLAPPSWQPGSLPACVSLSHVCRSSYAPLLSCINGTTSATCVSSSVSYTGKWFELMSDHNATRIPQSVTSGFSQGGGVDNTMANLPFYVVGQAHWSVRAQSGRWEADDNTANANCK